MLYHRTLEVRSLPFDVTEDELEKHFSNIGKVDRVVINPPDLDGECRALVMFLESNSVTNATSKHSSMPFRNTYLSIHTLDSSDESHIIKMFGLEVDNSIQMDKHSVESCQSIQNEAEERFSKDKQDITIDDKGLDELAKSMASFNDQQIELLLLKIKAIKFQNTENTKVKTNTGDVRQKYSDLSQGDWDVGTLSHQQPLQNSDTIPCRPSIAGIAQTSFGAPNGHNSGKSVVYPGLGSNVGYKYTSTIPPPRLPLFSGETSGKSGSVTYRQWKYHVNSLIDNPAYPDHVVIHAIHQSVRELAAEYLMNFDTQLSPSDLLRNFDSVFGNVLDEDQMSKQLFTSTQMQNETIVAWSCRVQKLVNDLFMQNQISIESAQQKLRSRFWNGLKEGALKEALRTSFSNGMPFHQLLTQARKLEFEFSSKVKDRSQAVAHQQATKHKEPSDNLVSKVDSIVKKLTGIETRLGKIESQQPHQKAERYKTKKRDETLHCTRCSHKGHTVDKCHAKRDVHGKHLNP